MLQIGCLNFLEWGVQIIRGTTVSIQRVIRSSLLVVMCYILNAKTLYSCKLTEATYIVAKKLFVRAL